MAGVRLGLLVELRQRVSVVIMVLLLVGVLQFVLVAQLRERGGGGYSGYQLTTLSTNMQYCTLIQCFLTLKTSYFCYVSES